MKSKTYKLPMYDERAENTYNTANREMTGNLGNWLLDNYETVGQVSPEQELKYQDISDKAMEAAWSDYNRELGKAQSVANSRAYNRFGSLTNTPALYDQESFARQANQGAVDLASNTAQYYNNLVNQDINRQLQAWQQYSNMYNKAGEDITTLDKYNWNIRNQNKDRKYTNDVSKFQAKVAQAQLFADALDPLQNIMKNFQNGNNSGSGLFNSFNQLGGGSSTQGFNNFMNNRYGGNAFGSGFNIPSIPTSTPNSMSLFNGVNDSWMNSINTSSPGWLGNISANLGSGSSLGNTGGSWLSNIGNWFKGLGGK